MTNRARIGVASTALAVLLSASHALAQSCAMCGSALGGPQDPLARAISWSVLFLMAAPYTIVGGAAAVLYFMYRRGPGRRRATVIDLARTVARLRPATPGDAPGGDAP
jgi:hypothetical protein